MMTLHLDDDGLDCHEPELASYAGRWRLGPKSVIKHTQASLSPCMECSANWSRWLLLFICILFDTMRVMCRYFPYSYETLVENLLDVGHVRARASILSKVHLQAHSCTQKCMTSLVRHSQLVACRYPSRMIPRYLSVRLARSLTWNCNSEVLLGSREPGNKARIIEEEDFSLVLQMHL